MAGVPDVSPRATWQELAQDEKAMLVDVRTDAEWNFVGRQLIEGVQIREVRNVPKGNGMMTEIFRRDWFDGDVVVEQEVHVLGDVSCRGLTLHEDARVDGVIRAPGGLKIERREA